MATQSDLIRFAHRTLGIVSAEESVSEDQNAYAVDVLEAIAGEFSALGFSITAPSTAYLKPLSDLLAVDLSFHYAVQPPMPRSRAIMALRAILLSDDREDPRDTDSDGSVSDAEAEAFARSVYY